MRNLQLLKSLFHYRQRVIFLSLISRLFNLSLVLSNLVIMCLKMNYLGWSCLRFAQHLKSIGLCVLPNLRSLGDPLFLKIYFSASYSSFWAFNYLNIRLFIVLPQVPEVQLIFFNILSFLFRLDNFYWSSFKFTSFLFLCYLYSAVESIQWFFFVLAVVLFFSSKISIWLILKVNLFILIGF